MKQYKAEMVEAIVKEAEGSRIVSLREIGNALGHKHIPTQDCLDIMRAVLKRLPSYKAVKVLGPGQSENTASLWTTLTFVQKDTIFEEAPQYEEAQILSL